MRHRVGVGRSKTHKVRGINSPIKYSTFFFSFCLSSALVKAEREVLLELTNLTQIYIFQFRNRSFRTVITVRLSSASEHTNNNKTVLKMLTFYDYYENKIFKEYNWHFLQT